MTYSVVYRTGGTQRCQWQKLFNTCQTIEQANANVERLERMGYKALRFETRVIDTIGLPIGWEPKSVDYARDTIIVDTYATLHIKAA